MSPKRLVVIYQRNTEPEQLREVGNKLGELLNDESISNIIIGAFPTAVIQITTLEPDSNQEYSCITINKNGMLHEKKKANTVW